MSVSSAVSVRWTNNNTNSKCILPLSRLQPSVASVALDASRTSRGFFWSTMVSRSLLVTLVAVLAVIVASTAEEVRHLRFNESYTEYVPVGPRLDALITNPNVHFMDITSGDPVASAALNPRAAGYVYPPQAEHKAVVELLAGKLSVDTIVANLGELTAYETRYYTSSTGVKAAGWVADLARVYAGAREDISVEVFKNDFPQDSVIVTVKGQTDAVVILGGHIDSVGSTTTGRAPGADDDGTGSMTTMEVFRVVAQNGIKPYNTLQFHFYAAEEAGLLGSKAIAAKYAKDGVVVVGMLQLDMTGYSGSSPSPVVGVVTDYTSKDYNAFLRILVDTYTSITWVDTKCGYACSDHASFTAVGYPAGFAFEAAFGDHSPYIHSDRDTIANLNLAHVANFARLGLSHVIELALLEPAGSTTTL